LGILVSLKAKSFTAPEMLLLTGLKRPGNGHRKNTFGSGAKEIGRIGLERCFLFFLLGKSLGKGVET
jgi:hypothetical protein